MTTQREFEAEQAHSDSEDFDYIFAVVCIMGTTVFWSLVGASAKYAAYFYNADPIELSIVSFTLSGLYGSCIIIYIVIYDVGFDLLEGNSFFIVIILCVL